MSVAGQAGLAMSVKGPTDVALGAPAASSVGGSADVVTFLLTDIEGSSLRWLHHRAAMQRALGEHDRILNDAVSAHGGYVFKTTGDGLYAAFELPSDAVNAAVAAQQALATRDWLAVGGMAVRMALHIGTAERRNGDYFGPAMNRAARLLALAQGGQILATAAAAEIIASERDCRHTFRLLGHYALDDPLQAVDVLQVDGAGLRCDFPPPPDTGGRPTNLPRQLAPLIGRDADRERLLALLGEHALVTLTGPGGVGKTRLALDAVAARRSGFAHGAWLIELAPISDPGLVAGVFASTLEIPLPPERPPLQALAARLRTQQLLLLVDNCEHVVDAAAQVVERILANAPGVRVLATSQEPLGLAGERVMRLSSLAVPHARHPAAADALRSGAVQLFVERASAADSDFAFNDRDAASVAAICRRLDGIPLAIEMAAARVPHLGVDALARKLDERFRILASNQRSALPRQQTLRATLDWSHSLLPENERVVFRRASVFSGGFTLQAAGAVLQDDEIDEFAIIDALGRLVARSLVVADTGEANTRYRLFETMRAYASERLRESGEAGALARRHALFYRDLFERAYADSWTSSDTAWLRAYAAERDNVRAALEWMLGSDGDAGSAVALAGASSVLWTYLALAGEERRWLERALPLASGVAAQLAARLWHRLGMTYVEAAPRRGLAAFERALDLPRDEVDTVTRASLYRSYAIALVLTGNTDEASAALAEAVTLAEDSGLPRLISEIITTRASIRLPAGDLQGARTDQQTALALFRGAGADRAALNTLSNLADADWAIGDLAAAVAGFREAAARLRQAPIVHDDLLAVTLGNLVGALTEQGDLDEARSVAREAIPLLREDPTAWLWFDHFALLAARCDRIDDAARLAGYAEAALVAHGRVRQPNEMRARASLDAIFADRLVRDECERYFAEGAKLGDDDAFRLALPERGEIRRIGAT
jgi:predicted ATPase/class 3 adenylate cyclase